MADQKEKTLGESSSGATHRKTERLPWDEPVEFLSPVKCTGQTLDIGAGGIGVEITETLPVDSLVEMKILNGHLIVHGRVRWVHLGDDGKNRVGIQFDHEDLSILTHIRNLLQLKG